MRLRELAERPGRVTPLQPDPQGIEYALYDTAYQMRLSPPGALPCRYLAIGENSVTVETDAQAKRCVLPLGRDMVELAWHVSA
jgi:hypothetical protein